MKTRLSFAVLLVILVTGCSPLLAQDTTRIYPVPVPSRQVPPPDFVPVDKEPEIVKSVIPYYPELAQKAGIEGRVILKIWVDEQGKPRDVTILKSDAEIFDRPAVEAAMKYRFTPAMLGKKPVGVWVVIPFTFKLKESKSPAEKPEETSAPSNLDYVVLQAAILEYNQAMQYERTHEYGKAKQAYHDFLEQVKKSRVKPDEMIRHAEFMIQEYENELKKSK